MQFIRFMAKRKVNYIKQVIKRLIPSELENENDVDDDVVRVHRNAAVNTDSLDKLQCSVDASSLCFGIKMVHLHYMGSV